MLFDITTDNRVSRILDIINDRRARFNDGATEHKTMFPNIKYTWETLNADGTYWVEPSNNTDTVWIPVAGFLSEDLQVDLTSDRKQIRVSGKTTIGGRDLSINSTFTVDASKYNLDAISAECKNGMLKILLQKTQEKPVPETKSIKIN